MRDRILFVLKDLRKSRHWLAERAQKEGIGRATVYDFLSGAHDIASESAHKLLVILELEKNKKK